MIKEKLGTLFVKENETRWNSLYNAMFRLQHFLTRKGDMLEELMEIFKIEQFRPAEVEYVSEYTKVISLRTVVIYCVLLLFSDNEEGSQRFEQTTERKKCAMGYLLPTISMLILKLATLVMDPKIKHLVLSVKGLLDSLSAR
jgi:hypothetical protein